MLLPHSDAMRFIDGYKSALFEVLLAAGKKRSKNVVSNLAAARSLAKKDATAIPSALAALRARGDVLDEDVSFAIMSLRVGRWIHLRHTARYALLFDEKAENAYAVKALTTPLHELFNGKTFIFEAGLVEYQGHYVCDGIGLQPVHLGPGISSELKSAYAHIKAAGRFHGATAKM